MKKQSVLLKRKIIGIVFCSLLITTIIPVSLASEQSLSTSQDDFEVYVYAGLFGSDIGFGVSIWTVNNKEEKLDVSYVFTMVFPRLWKPNEFNYSAPIGHWVFGFDTWYFGFFELKVTVEETSLNRSGMVIGKLVIFRPGVEIG